MRSRVLVLGVLFAAALGMSGCASLYPMGTLYTGVKLPNNMGDGKDISYTRVGTAKATTFFTLIATGDASLDAAIKNGGLRTVKYVDFHVDNILGVYGKYTTTAYGD